MNENYAEVKWVTVDMPTKCITYMVENYINGGRIKKIWVTELDNFVCIKMSIDAESGEGTFTKFIKLDSIVSMEVMYG